MSMGPQTIYCSCPGQTSLINWCILSGRGCDGLTTLSWGWAAPASDWKVGCRGDVFSVSVMVDGVLFGYDSFMSYLPLERI